MKTTESSHGITRKLSLDSSSESIRESVPASPSTSVLGPEISDASSRRTTVDIYADILEVVKRHGGRGRITRISYGVGMPVDRLKKFLEKLENFGLVRTNEIDTDDSGVTNAFLLTSRGQEFLDVYWRMKGFLDVFEEDL